MPEPQLTDIGRQGKWTPLTGDDAPKLTDLECHVSALVEQRIADDPVFGKTRNRQDTSRRAVTEMAVKWTLQAVRDELLNQRSRIAVEDHRPVQRRVNRHLKEVIGPQRYHNPFADRLLKSAVKITVTLVMAYVRAQFPVVNVVLAAGAAEVIDRLLQGDKS